MSEWDFNILKFIATYNAKERREVHGLSPDVLGVKGFDPISFNSLMGQHMFNRQEVEQAAQGRDWP